jgi:transcriptional regulator with XRE-family HTH domain
MSENDQPQAFAARLRSLRTVNGFTVEEVERRTGILANEYERWEAGADDRPPHQAIATLASLFGAHPAELLDAAGWGEEATIARLHRP